MDSDGGHADEKDYDYSYCRGGLSFAVVMLKDAAGGNPGTGRIIEAEFHCLR